MVGPLRASSFVHSLRLGGLRDEPKERLHGRLAITCVAGVRKGRGRKFGRDTAHLSRFSRARNLLPVPFQKPEKVLGLTWYRVKVAAK